MIPNAIVDTTEAVPAAVKITARDLRTGDTVYAPDGEAFGIVRTRHGKTGVRAWFDHPVGGVRESDWYDYDTDRGNGPEPRIMTVTR